MRVSLLAAAVAAGAPGLAHAAVIRWDGGGVDTNWSTANNWAPNGAPASAATNDLEFGSVVLVAPQNTTANNTTNNFLLNSITFNGTANASFTVTGSELDLQADAGTQPSIVQNSSLAHSISNVIDVLGTQLTLGGNGTGVVTMSGEIMGAKPVIKNGTGTYLITGNNNQSGTWTINAGTLIAGHVNALDNNMAITVNNTGTLAIASGLNYTRAVTFNSGSTLSGEGTANYNPGGTFTVNNGVTVAPGIGAGAVNTFTIGTATTFASGGILSADVSGTTADRLNVTGNLNLNAGSVLNVNVGSAPTLGRYRVLDYSGTRTGTFTTTNNVPTNYRVDYNNADTAVDIRHNATIGTINVTPLSTSIITGGSTGVNLTVQNSAPTDSFALAFTASAGTNMTGSATGTVNANGSGGPSSNTLAFNGTTVGAAQTGTVSVADANATNSPQNGNVSVDVYDHASGSTSATALTIPNVIVGYGAAVNSTGTLNVDNAAGFRVNLKTTNNGPSNLVSLANASGVAAGGSQAIGAQLATGRGAGAISESITLTFADDSPLSGASSNLGTQAISVTGGVLDHANGSFDNPTDTNTLNLNFGQVAQSSTQSQGFNLYNLLATIGYTAALDLDAINGTGDTGIFTHNVTPTQIAAGAGNGYTIFFNTGTLGAYAATYTIDLSDEDLPGGSELDDLTINIAGEVVPEPTTGVAVLAAGLLAGTMRPRRRRKQNVR